MDWLLVSQDHAKVPTKIYQVKISSKKPWPVPQRKEINCQQGVCECVCESGFFNMNWNIIWCFFSPEPPPCGLPWSPPARSKVIFDGMDNSFHRDRQDTVRACPSLKLPSNCQRHSLINHFKRRSKLVPWQSRDKQWYENSASRETYMLYHSLRFEIIHALL